MVMKHVDDFPRKVVEFSDMGITMPDGCRLSGKGLDARRC